VFKNGKSKPTLCSGTGVAHYPSLPQKGISPEIRKRQKALAVGSIEFVEDIQARLGTQGFGRKIEEQDSERFVLREETELYRAEFEPENGRLSQNNRYIWDIYSIDSMG
jgi:hypothetical protein